MAAPPDLIGASKLTRADELARSLSLEKSLLPDVNLSSRLVCSVCTQFGAQIDVRYSTPLAFIN